MQKNNNPKTKTHNQRRINSFEEDHQVLSQLEQI